VRFAKRVGDHELRQEAADRFIARPPEHELGLLVPFRHVAVRVHPDHGVERSVEEALCAFLAFPR
jgi:hypothetical protein